MTLQPGQYPALPAPLSAARPTTPATYVPCTPELLDVSDVPLRTFQPGTVWPLKSGSWRRPVSSTATTTPESPRVTSQACVVCVCVQPHAPPARADEPLGKKGSSG